MALRWRGEREGGRGWGEVEEVVSCMSWSLVVGREKVPHARDRGRRRQIGGKKSEAT